MEEALEPRVIASGGTLSGVGPRLRVNRKAPADRSCRQRAKYTTKGEVLDCSARCRAGAFLPVTAREDPTSAMSPSPISPIPSDRPVSLPLASTGIDGLDAVLNGGFTANRLYLIEGTPGSGKTTLALQFLLEGVRQGE